MLDPEIDRIVGSANSSGAPEYCDMSVEEARLAHEEKAPLLGAPAVPLASVTDGHIPGRFTEIPVRIYRTSLEDAIQPCLVFYHGGGHVIGSLNSYDTLCRQLALQSGVVVVSVDYRLAPEYRFPAAVEDAFDAYEWLATNGESWGIDPCRLAIAGDSAGGNLVAVVALLVREAGIQAPCHQLMVYPATAPYPDSPSQLQYAENHILTRRLILWFHEQYLTYADHLDFRWAPLLAHSHEDLPPSTIILAQCDPLRDEGIEYAHRLIAAGNDVTLSVFSGTTHPFFSWSGVSTKARAAVSFAALQIRNALDEATDAPVVVRSFHQPFG